MAFVLSKERPIGHPPHTDMFSQHMETPVNAMWGFQSRKFQKEGKNNETSRFWISSHITVILGPSEGRGGPVFTVRQEG